MLAVQSLVIEVPNCQHTVPRLTIAVQNRTVEALHRVGLVPI
jgi:hypothetical protein